MFRIFIISILLLVGLHGFGQEFDSNSLSKIQGRWVHDKDSLSQINIIGDIWIYCNKGEQTTEQDSLKITIEDRAIASDSVTLVTCLLMENSFHYEMYEILNLNDSILSLMHVPTGRLNLYKRQSDSKHYGPLEEEY